jgi:hypothetical protein
MKLRGRLERLAKLLSHRAPVLRPFARIKIPGPDKRQPEMPANDRPHIIEAQAREYGMIRIPDTSRNCRAGPGAREGTPMAADDDKVAAFQALAELAVLDSAPEALATLEVLDILMLEPGRPCLGRILNNLALDWPRPFARGATQTAARLRRTYARSLPQAGSA